ncbi:MAG: glutamyl-tRNA amidotransferase [Acidithiobacillales bacterium SM23_46]|jgi:uncharacterized protein YqeY|nr:MAG: glutamyl-tRNA amidotransferase [Acidithiobacillales bacterium SM23_46]KPL28895.1 MAG: glutamyl-tRNA amidotransferase [Acidithiobacillales bacterium SM1_46]
MSLKQAIQEDLKTAMRERAEARLVSLRMLTAAIKQREVDERIELDDARIVGVVEKLIKQSRESIDQYTKGNRPDLAAKEQADIAVWQVYMPKQLSDAEVDDLIAEAIASTGAASIKDMGKVMGVLKPKLAGRADMGAVGGKIKAKLGA